MLLSGGIYSLHSAGFVGICINALSKMLGYEACILQSFYAVFQGFGAVETFSTRESRLRRDFGTQKDAPSKVWVADAAPTPYSLPRQNSLKKNSRKKNEKRRPPGHAFSLHYSWLKVDQAQADLQGIIHLFHRFLVQVGDFVRQPLLVNGSDLLQQYDRVPVKAMRSRIDFDMRRQLGFLNLGRNRRYDDRRTETVADIVLDDQHRSYSALFRTDNG